MRCQKEGTGSVSLLSDGESREVVVVDPHVSGYFLSQCASSDAG